MVTFRQWLELSAAARAVVLDEVLERLPPGYLAATDVGHAPAAVPQYLHPATGGLFHLVLGDEPLLGMSPRRLARVSEVQRSLRRLDDEAYDLPQAVPSEEEARPFTPRRLPVPPVLVGEVLTEWQLRKLGVPGELLAAGALRPAGVGAALKALGAVGLRFPSEVEWEFTVRAAADDLDDQAPPTQPELRFLPDLGAGPELCRDSWHPDWTQAPGGAEAWGEGHEVVRGGGQGSRYTGWLAKGAWTECVWPSRRQLSAAPGPVRVRPFASLRPATR
jgi:hypothetical protein